jgi:hypothetical protein
MPDQLSLISETIRKRGEDTRAKQDAERKEFITAMHIIAYNWIPNEHSENTLDLSGLYTALQQIARTIVNIRNSGK